MPCEIDGELYQRMLENFLVPFLNQTLWKYPQVLWGRIPRYLKIILVRFKTITKLFRDRVPSFGDKYSVTSEIPSSLRIIFQLYKERYFDQLIWKWGKSPDTWGKSLGTLGKNSKVSLKNPSSLQNYNQVLSDRFRSFRDKHSVTPEIPSYLGIISKLFGERYFDKLNWNMGKIPEYLVKIPGYLGNKSPRCLRRFLSSL